MLPLKLTLRFFFINISNTNNQSVKCNLSCSGDGLCKPWAFYIIFTLLLYSAVSMTYNVTIWKKNICLNQVLVFKTWFAILWDTSHVLYDRSLWLTGLSGNCMFNSCLRLERLCNLAPVLKVGFYSQGLYSISGMVNSLILSEKLYCQFAAYLVELVSENCTVM